MGQKPLAEILIRELQQINYPILWGGHPARPTRLRQARCLPPQEVIGCFFIWKSLKLKTKSGVESDERRYR